VGTSWGSKYIFREGDLEDISYTDLMNREWFDCFPPPTDSYISRSGIFIKRFREERFKETKEASKGVSRDPFPRTALRIPDTLLPLFRRDQREVFAPPPRQAPPVGRAPGLPPGWRDITINIDPVPLPDFDDFVNRAD